MYLLENQVKKYFTLGDYLTVSGSLPQNFFTHLQHSLAHPHIDLVLVVVPGISKSQHFILYTKFYFPFKSLLS